MEPAPSDRITQAELKNYREYSEAVRVNAAAAEALKARILRKMGESLPVEDGDLIPTLHVSESKRITNGEIERMMGAEVLANLKAGCNPTTSVSLKIESKVAAVLPTPVESAEATMPAYRRLSRAAQHFAVLALAVLAGVGPVRAQALPEGRKEVVTTEPRLGSTVCNAPLPADLHIRNEGSDVDGAGLCVISSILLNGRYQGVPGLEGGKDSEIWRKAKAAPGGYYPEKLERLLKEVLPGEKWVSWEGEGTDLVQAYSAGGYPVGVTTNTGELYGGQSIHHMVSNAHLDDKVACIVDNNAPRKYIWVTKAEFARRFPDGGKGWGFVWLRKPYTEELLFLASALLLASSALLLPANVFYFLGTRNAYRASRAA